MNDKLIEPDNYTPEIKTSITRIKNRMHHALIDFTDDDIKVFEHGDMYYILANPVLGEEPIYDNVGNFQEMTPMHNLTLIYDDDWLSTRMDGNKLVFTSKIPRLRILRPDLCDRVTIKSY